MTSRASLSSGVLKKHMIPETGGVVANVAILAGKWRERAAAREGVS
jgi:hypothetical protein